MSSDPFASSEAPPPDDGTPPTGYTPATGATPPMGSAPTTGSEGSAAPTGSAPLPESAVTFTKAAAMWGALVTGFLILIVLLIFIAQNTESTEFAFLGWRWNQPLGVAIMFAAVAGGLLTFVVGAVRIFQLRRAAKKNLKAGL